MGRCLWLYWLIAACSCLSFVSVYGYECYICNSKRKANCYRPGSNTNKGTCQYGCNMKAYQYNVNSVSVVRGCSRWEQLDEIGCVGLMLEDGTPGMECSCQADLCNSGEITPNISLEQRHCYDCDYYGTYRNLVEDVVCRSVDNTTPKKYCPYGHCKKIHYQSGDYVGIARMCTDEVAEYNLTECTVETGNGVTYTICHCNDNKCNTASTYNIQSVITNLVTAGIITWLYSHL